VIEGFRDGRGAWPFSEMWAARLFDFIKHSNSNNPVSDGAVALDALRDVRISVKALTRGGVKFQQSRDVGIGRTSTRDRLIAAIEACDRVLVVDVVEFPVVGFVPVDATRLVGAVHRGDLTTGGWSRPRLHGWLGATYRISRLPLNLLHSPHPPLSPAPPGRPLGRLRQR
jgi:hypothetical protein